MVNRIELRAVSYAYPSGTRALDDISLSIAEGERVAIIGQNGAGKTTAVKLMNGLLKPASGSVLVNGDDTTSRTTAQLARQVGYVFQNPDDQIFSKSVADEVAYSLKRMRLGREQLEERVAAALQATGLAKHAGTNPLDLPHSTRRFVTIAVVLAIDPAFIVLDEPTAGQDRAGVRLLAELLELFSREGKGAIVITHDMEFVAEHFDRVVVMADRRVVMEGTPREVFWQEAALRTARLERPRIGDLAHSIGAPGRALGRAELVSEIVGAAQTAVQREGRSASAE